MCEIMQFFVYRSICLLSASLLIWKLFLTLEEFYLVKWKGKVRKCQGHWYNLFPCDIAILEDILFKSIFSRYSLKGKFLSLNLVLWNKMAGQLVLNRRRVCVSLMCGVGVVSPSVQTQQGSLSPGAVYRVIRTSCQTKHALSGKSMGASFIVYKTTQQVLYWNTLCIY